MMKALEDIATKKFGEGTSIYLNFSTHTIDVRKDGKIIGNIEVDGNINFKVTRPFNKSLLQDSWIDAVETSNPAVSDWLRANKHVWLNLMPITYSNVFDDFKNFIGNKQIIKGFYIHMNGIHNSKENEIFKTFGCDVLIVSYRDTQELFGVHEASEMIMRVTFND